MRLLSEDQDRLVADVRATLVRLQTALATASAAPADLETLGTSIAHLDRLFLLVVVGEFNAGKSAFINALLGQAVLAEGVTPTTTRIQILTHGPETARVASTDHEDRLTAPVELLRDLEIVDTPGTNAIYREHETLTSDFVPKADLVLFVTSADRPFTESERAFLHAIRAWGKKIVFVINKVDILEREDEAAEVGRFVSSNARALVETDPLVFPVSARRAIRAQQGEALPPVSWDRFDDLKQYIVHTLDAAERIRLKLLNPLGVGGRLLERAKTGVGARQDLLRDDVTTIEEIERDLDLYRGDLTREFKYRLSHVDAVLHEFEHRGIAFFDEMLRVGRVFDLLNKSKVQAEFERTVVADVPQQIDRRVHEIIDWLVASDLRQWQGVTERLRQRRAVHPDRIVGELGGRFTYDRERLLDTVGRSAERAVATYDASKEASEMAMSVRRAVAGAALAEAGAVSLGAVVTALATTTFADVTGLVAAGTVALVGLFVIPVRRQRAKRTLRERIEAMRVKLMEALRTQFEREVQAGVDRVRDGMAPYARFVRAERENLSNVQAELARVDDEIAGVRARVETLR